MLTKFLFILSSLLFIVPFLGPHQTALTYHAQSFDTKIEIHPDGAMIVSETVELRSDEFPITEYSRTIQTDENDGVTFLEASLDGLPMQKGINTGQVEVNGNPLKVTWHFIPTNDKERLFYLQYRVEGVIRKDEMDTLKWQFVPSERGYPISNASVTIHTSINSDFSEPAVLDKEFTSQQTAVGVRLITHNLALNEGVTLTAHFPPGSFGNITPQWQLRKQEAELKEKQDQVNQKTITILLGVGLILLIGLIVAAILITHYRKRHAATK